MRTLNRDQLTRDEILKPYIPEWCTKCFSREFYHIDYLPLAKLEKLAELNFIDLTDRQNESPSAGEFLEFMRKYPCFTAHGYAIGEQRDDYRVSITGLQWKPTESKAELRSEEMAAFIKLCNKADEYTLNDKVAWAWWD